MLKTFALATFLLQAGAAFAVSASASILFTVKIPVVVKLVVNKDGKVEVFTNARRGQLSYRFRDTPEVALP